MRKQPFDSMNMPGRRASSDRTSEENLSQTDMELEDSHPRRYKRIASVYDAVAGRVGFNGFLSRSQLEIGATALKPEEVMLRRVGAPSGVKDEYYNGDALLKPDQRLPDAEVVKAVHQYASDYYAAHADRVNHNYRSFDETAMLALAMLMEEATVGSLGENGDMVLIEPEGLEDGLPESAMAKHQVRGRVKPPPTPDPPSSEEAGTSSEDDVLGDDRQTKRRRHTYAG